METYDDVGSFSLFEIVPYFKRCWSIPAFNQSTQHSPTIFHNQCRHSHASSLWTARKTDRPVWIRIQLLKALRKNLKTMYFGSIAVGGQHTFPWKVLYTCTGTHIHTQRLKPLSIYMAIRWQQEGSERKLGENNKCWTKYETKLYGTCSPAESKQHQVKRTISTPPGSKFRRWDTKNLVFLDPKGSTIHKFIWTYTFPSSSLANGIFQRNRFSNKRFFFDSHWFIYRKCRKMQSRPSTLFG